jgi:hypothetical protein
MLIVLLKIDLTKEDIPGAEDTVGAAMLFANVFATVASLVLALLIYGLEARDAIKTWEEDEEDEEDEDRGDKKGKKGKTDKKEVRHTELMPSCLLAVKPSSLSFTYEC